MKNPWLGLSSYTEESLEYYQFNGRGAASAALASLIRQNLFVTLYGRSGIGKTSLLQGGVYPILRRDGFSPITIRLAEIKDTDLPSETIWNKTLRTLSKIGFEYQFYNDNEDYIPDFSDILVFRKLFSAGHFLNEVGEEIIPVIVLDQFEEVLYKAPLASRLLISQLYAVIDDSYNLEISHPEWHDDTDFRFVVSIREDDLYLFEDFIDNLHCIDFKSNRYRLLPLTEEEAREVVLNPIKNVEIFEDGKEEEIAQGIVEISKNKGQNINTLLLSLICYNLFEKSQSENKKISKDDVGNYKDIIKSYYEAAVKDLPKEERFYLEDNLVDDQGRRKQIYLEDLERHAPKAKDTLIDNSDKRLLNNNQGRIELIHDQLADSVWKIRTNRKSNTTKKWGVCALILLLLATFLFSISFPIDYAYFENYQKATGLVSDVTTTSINVTLDSKNPTLIDDCPSLKSINIEGTEGDLKIYNCPSLVEINLSQDFEGDITVFNCPNLKKDNIKKYIHELEVQVSQAKNYISQYPNIPLDSIYLYSPFFDSIKQSDGVRGDLKYDSLSKTFTIQRHLRAALPYKKGSNMKVKITTNLPDSIKRETVCIVPWGEKEKFSRLVEYQPFKSIEELPLYYLWGERFKDMFGFFSYNKLWDVLAILGILFVQCLFWIISFVNNKAEKKLNGPMLWHVFIFGLGMSGLAVLSFMAFYWLTFQFILIYNQPLSSIIGVIGSICCLGIVYRNYFYSFRKYIQIHGIRGTISNIKKGLQNLPAMLISFWKSFQTDINQYISYIHKYPVQFIGGTLVVGLLITSIISYINGTVKREHYIQQVYKIISQKQYGKAYAIINELDSQKKSWLYPFFEKKLKVAKSLVEGDSIRLFNRITPEYVKNLAMAKAPNLDFKEVDEVLAVSEDATKFVFVVKYPKSNDLLNNKYQAILIDNQTQTLYALNPKTTHNFYYTDKCSFSPSGKSLTLKVDRDIYIITDNGENGKKILKKETGSIDNLLLANDSVYYYTKYGELYQGFLDKKPDVSINSTAHMFNNLTMITDYILGGRNSQGQIIIYDVSRDSVLFQSQEYIASSLRAINLNYAVTDKGLFSIDKDTIINENEKLYDFKGNVVELYKKNGQYSFHDLNGKEIVKIITDKEDELDNLKFSKDGKYMININKSEISIYSIVPIAESNWELSDEDKKMFDLK